MPRKKKSDVGYIRDLDILQSGVNTKDPTEDMDKNENKLRSLFIKWN